MKLKKKSSPLKLLSQSQPNFAEMILGWPPSKIVSGDPRLPTKMAAKLKIEKKGGLSDTILKGNHPGTIPARIGLIWFSSFRGEDLNVIFYQNMSNLHNWYKSAERKISRGFLWPM
jgi:hypothetical protein